MSEDKRIVIGCPLSGREWAVKPWFDYVLASLIGLDLDVSFAFVINEGDTVADVVHEYLQEIEMPGVFYEVPPFPVETKDHVWSIYKYEYMAAIRNTLLELVQTLKPDLFLSLDSDILLHPQALQGMIASIDGYGAVGGKTYLHRTNKLPNYANLNKTGNLIRPDFKGVAEVDVLMAIKLMQPEAYNISYKTDRRGEDIGWSLNCQEAKVKLCFDGRFPSKHIMDYSQLSTIDKRVGY
jgi:hypothetical protein